MSPTQWHLLAIVLLLILKRSACSSNGSFAEAILLSDVNNETIVIQSQEAGPAFQKYLHGPFLLERNITVTGAEGVNTVLDLQFWHGVVQLCPSCVFTFKNITIANERRGNGSPVDFFSGKPGSIIMLDHVNRLRLACASAPDSATVVDNTPRSKLLPNQTGQQVYDLENATFQGAMYPRTLVTKDYSADIPFEVQEDRNPQGGYALSAKQMHRLCKNTISKDCLAVKSTEACVNDLIDELLEKGAALTAGAGSSSTAGTPPIAAIVVPLVLAGLLLSALVLGLVWLRKRKATKQQQQQQQQQLMKGQPPVKVAGQLAASTVASKAGSDTVDSSPQESDGILELTGGDVEQGLKQQQQQQAYKAADHVPGSSRSAHSGWVKASSMTAAAFGEATDSKADKIRFGDLLGAGGFGRVFRATWRGRDVAVKVIEHDLTATQDVENEVKLMMSLDHDCLVRAFHFVTYTQTPEPGSSGALDHVRHRARQRRSIDQRSAASPLGVYSSRSSHSGPISTPLAPQGSYPIAGSSDSNVVSSGQSTVVTGPSPAVAGEAAAAGASQDSRTVSGISDQQQQQQQYQQIGSASLPLGGGGSPTLQPGLSRDDTAAAAAVVKQPHPGATGWWSPTHTPPGTAANAAAHVASAGSTPAATTASSSSGGVPSSSRNLDDVDRSWCPLGDTPSTKAESHLVMECCDRGPVCKVATELQLQQQQQCGGSDSGSGSGGGDEGGEVTLLLLLQDVAKGLQVLHSRNIVHGDLNARNVLVSSSTSARCGMTAKLADFGLSRSIKQQHTHRTTKARGTISHMPAELLKDGHMSPAVDIYAFGIMMWELWTASAAFKDLHFGAFYAEVVIKGLRPTIPAGMPDDYQALMQHCWSTEPADRPKVSAVLEAIAAMIAARPGPSAATAAGGEAAAGAANWE